MGACDSCGAEVDVGARFCGECGALVRATTREMGSDGRGKARTSPQPTGKGRSREMRDTVRETRRGKGERDTKGELRSTVRGVATSLPVPTDSAAAAPPAPLRTIGAPLADPLSASALQTKPAITDAAAMEPMSVKLERTAPTPVAAKAVAPAPKAEEPDAGKDRAAAPSAKDLVGATIPAPPAGEEDRSEFQRLLDEVESGFDAILVTSESSPPPPSRTSNSVAPPSGIVDEETSPHHDENQFDQEQAKALFQDLVVANAQSIRDFMIEVRLGEPHSAWLDHCEPAAQAILRSAEAMGFSELVEKLKVFLDSIRAARVSVTSSKVIRGELREALIDSYSDLISFFPEAFAAEAESNRREAMIVKALLSKVPGLFHLAIDRIHATGFVSLGLFYVSRPKELAALAGTSLEVAERIVERFREYRRTVSELSPARGRAEERKAIRAAIEELARANRAYEAAAPASSERRVHRRERTLAMADITIGLARLGEIDRLQRLEKMGFSARIEALHAFLEESERRALAEQKAR